MFNDTNSQCLDESVVQLLAWNAEKLAHTDQTLMSS